MKLVELSCPSCGAQMQVNPELKCCTCNFCGKQMIIDDEIRKIEVDQSEAFGYGFEKGRMDVLKGEADKGLIDMVSRIKSHIEEKKRLVLDHGFALWDVIASCEIVGSSDSSITNVIPNDLRPILNAAPIQRIFANGQTAGKLYRTHIEPLTGRPAFVLPSTSPANAAWSLPRLIEAWQVIHGDT